MTPADQARRQFVRLARRGIRALPGDSREVALSLASQRSAGPILLAGPPDGPVLVVAPHPDDEVIGPGGAVARHAQAGDDVRVLVVTDGTATSGGGGDVASRRRAETVRALARLGVEGPPSFAALPDGGLVDHRAEITAIIDTHVRDVSSVYVPWVGDSHADHRAVAVALAQVGLADDVTIYSYEVWGAAPVNVVLDVTAVFARKQAALAEYTTALEAVDYVRAISGLGAYRSASGGLGGRGFAEGFVRSSVAEYRRLAEGVSG